MKPKASHIPWPLPNKPWIMTQTWRDILFIHRPVAPAFIRQAVPDRLQLDTYEGTAWISVVPFYMSGIRLRGCPPMPFTSRFPQLNVRTYVTYGARPGVYLFSADAANRIVGKLARLVYHLPYRYAEMEMTAQHAGVTYSSRRENGTQAFRCRYKPVSEPYRSNEGTLEHWLTERYVLYTVNKRRVYRGAIHHPPWSLQKAEADIEQNTMIPPSIRPKEGASPLLHFAERQDVRLWFRERV